MLNINHIYILLKKYPNYNWNFSTLSQNPNITWQIVQEFAEKPWDYTRLSENPNITWQIVQDNPDKPWDYDYLSQNPNITWQIVKDNLDKPWNYDYLSQNPNITWQIIKNNMYKPWNLKFHILYNKNYNINEIDDMINYYTKLELNITISKYIYEYISQCPNITWEYVSKNLDKTWNFNSATLLTIIPIEELIKRNVFTDAICYKKTIFLNINKYIDHNFIKKYNNSTIMPINWYDLSFNNNISLDLIEQYIDKPWSWNILTFNKAVTWDFIKKHKNKPWNFSYIDLNPSINIKYIINDIEQIDKYTIIRYFNSTVFNIYDPIFSTYINKEFLKLKKATFFSTNHNFNSRYFINVFNTLSVDEINNTALINGLSVNSFNKDPKVRNHLLMYKYFNLWCKKSKFIKNTRALFKSEFSASLDLIRMRYNDITDRKFKNNSPKFLLS